MLTCYDIMNGCGGYSYSAGGCRVFIWGMLCKGKGWAWPCATEAVGFSPFCNALCVLPLTLTRCMHVQPHHCCLPTQVPRPEHHNQASINMM
jgi:hypothetical protein